MPRRTAQTARTALALDRRLSDSRLDVLDDNGHFPMLERPSGFRQIIRRFLDALPRTADDEFDSRADLASAGGICGTGDAGVTSPETCFPDFERGFMPRFLQLCLAAVLAYATGCGGDAPPDGAASAERDSASTVDSFPTSTPGVSPDTAVAPTVVAPTIAGPLAVDSSGSIVTLQADSGASATGPDSTVSSESGLTGPVQTLPQGPTQAVARDPLLDSLRIEVSRLTATVAALARAQAAAPAQPAAAEQAGATTQPIGTAGRAAPPTTEQLLGEARDSVRNYGLRSFWALIILGLTMLAVRSVVAVLNTLSERSATRRLFYKRLVPIGRIALWTVAVFFTIRVVFDVDAQGLITAAAAVGVAVGFAAQDILKNIFGGLVIVFDQPFQAGDKIKVGDSYGEVTSIGLRSTRIVTPDDSLVSVPNADIVANQVSNANSGVLDCQVVVDLYLPGWVDEARAKAIAYQAAASSKYVYLAKPIVVLVKDEFRETFITHLKVKAYVMDARHEFAFMSDITERARGEFRRAGLIRPGHGARAWVPVDANGAGTDAEPLTDRVGK